MKPNWSSIGRTALYSAVILLAIAIVVGSVALIIHMIGIGSPDDDETDSGFATETDKDTDDDTDTDKITDDGDITDTNDETDSLSDDSGTTDDNKNGDDSDSGDDTTTGGNVNETIYDNPRTLYALYNVNARMSPTTDSDIYGMYYQGDSITVTGETDNGWYRVNWRGYIAYIRNDLLTEDSSAAGVTITEYDAPVTMYASANVNVRENHTTSSSKLGMLEIGTEISVTGKTSNGWYRVIYNDSEAYVSEDYLSKEMPEIPAETTGTAGSES